MNAKYFVWLCSLVVTDLNHTKYSKLLRELYETEFIYILPMDENREKDGFELRYIYTEQTNTTDITYDAPCSVLEMMIALAQRCEEHIMHNEDYGDRMSKWFWEMVENMGLKEMTDSKYDRAFVKKTLKTLLSRTYSQNGEGGLFTVNNGKNIRDTEIWYQAMWYLSSIADITFV